MLCLRRRLKVLDPLMIAHPAFTAAHVDLGLCHATFLASAGLREIPGCHTELVLLAVYGTDRENHRRWRRPEAGQAVSHCAKMSPKLDVSYPVAGVKG